MGRPGSQIGYPVDSIKKLWYNIIRKLGNSFHNFLSILPVGEPHLLLFSHLPTGKNFLVKLGNDE